MAAAGLRRSSQLLSPDAPELLDLARQADLEHAKFSVEIAGPPQ
jgi:hypothetical protein